MEVMVAQCERSQYPWTVHLEMVTRVSFIWILPESNIFKYQGYSEKNLKAPGEKLSDKTISFHLRLKTNVFPLFLIVFLRSGRGHVTQ